MSISYPQYPNTEFPEKVDTFKEFLDMDINDFEKVKQYQTALENQDMTEANRILKTIPHYEQKILSAVKLNELRDAILAISQFYKTDVHPYILDKQDYWKSIVDEFEYLGEWNGGAYTKNNMVLSNGDIYINIYSGFTPIGTPPTNERYWRKLTIEGKQGDASEKCTFDFAWESDKYYQLNAIVTHGNIWWQCISPNKAIEPTTSQTETWKPILTPTQLIYPITKEEPVNQQGGELWFKVIRKE